MGAWEDGYAEGYRRAYEHAQASMSGRFSGTNPHQHGSQIPKPGPRTKRKRSAYNRYMSKELKKLRKKHPRTNQATLFKRAAKSWKRKKGKR